MSSKSSAKSSSKRQEPLKQGTLSFATVKRVASGNATSKSKSLKQTQLAPAHKTSVSVVSTEDDFDDIEFQLSDDESEDEIQDSAEAPEGNTFSRACAQTRETDKHTTAKKASREKKPVASATAKSGAKVSKARPDDVSKTGKSADEKPELDVKDRKWSKHYAEVRNKMGHLPAIHAENQNKIDEILRVFDLSYEYGPCVGIPRLERWERAQALGLNPPKEVYDILNTRQGSTLYSQSVFHDQV